MNRFVMLRIAAVLGAGLMLCCSACVQIGSDPSKSGLPEKQREEIGAGILEEVFADFAGDVVIERRNGIASARVTVPVGNASATAEEECERFQSSGLDLPPQAEFDRIDGGAGAASDDWCTIGPNMREGGVYDYYYNVGDTCDVVVDLIFGSEAAATLHIFVFC